MSGVHRSLSIVLVALVFVMEGYDLNAMALAAPRLDGPLGLDPATFGWVFTAFLVGLGIGGALIAPLGDRIGRRPILVVGCIAVACLTLMTTQATSLTEFFAWRLATGVSLGACLPNCSALAAELAPPRFRATLIAVTSSGIPVGLGLAGLFAPEVIAVGGWQGLFVVPGIFAAALALALWLVLPPGQLSPDRATEGSRLPQLALFRKPWLVPFAIFAAMLGLNAITLYLLNSWLPTVLPKAGFSLDGSARIAGTVQLAGLAIGVLASLLIDRWRPAVTMIAVFVSIAASFAAIGLTPPGTAWIALLMVGVGGASAVGLALPALSAYIFPERMLSTAVGMGVMIGRVGAFAGPPIGQAMINGGASAQLFFAAAAVPAAVCALVALGIPLALAVKPREEARASCVKSDPSLHRSG